jgi:hypothetical protein
MTFVGSSVRGAPLEGFPMLQISRAEAMPLSASHQIAVSAACATDDQGRHERSPPDLPASGQPNMLLRDMAARISSARQRQLIRLHAVALERAARSVSTLAPGQVQICPTDKQGFGPARPLTFP